MSLFVAGVFSERDTTRTRSEYSLNRSTLTDVINVHLLTDR
jgi:hypothetical protein